MNDKATSRNGVRLNGMAPWVTIGLFILVQTATFSWFLSNQSTRLSVAERAIEARSSHPLRIGVLEDRYRTISALLEEIKRDLKTALQKRLER